MTTYSSRPPFNDDPEPYVNGHLTRQDHPFEGGCCTTRYEPRQHYDRPQHNPTNPILLDIRERYRGDWWAMLRTYEYVTGNAAHYGTKEWLRITDEDLISHAHRVLTRLAAIGSGK